MNNHMANGLCRKTIKIVRKKKVYQKTEMLKEKKKTDGKNFRVREKGSSCPKPKGKKYHILIS